jgi:hypothetical protein
MDIKSVIAVLGGMVLVYFLGGILEGPLVGWLGSERPTTMEQLMAVRNEPAVLAGRIAVAGAVGLLAGYVVAKIAGGHELAHAAVSAALQAFMLLRAFAADPPAAAAPMGMRMAMVAVTAGAMIAGAAIRARAARLAPPTEVRS